MFNFGHVTHAQGLRSQLGTMEVVIRLGGWSCGQWFVAQVHGGGSSEGLHIKAGATLFAGQCLRRWGTLHIYS